MPPRPTPMTFHWTTHLLPAAAPLAGGFCPPTGLAAIRISVAESDFGSHLAALPSSVAMTP